MVNGKFFYLPCQCVSRSSWMGIWSESEMGQMFGLELVKCKIWRKNLNITWPNKLCGFKIFIFEILTHMPHGPHNPSYPCGMHGAHQTHMFHQTHQKIYAAVYDAVLAPTSLLWKVDMGGEGRWGSGEEEEEIPSSENIHDFFYFIFWPGGILVIFTKNIHMGISTYQVRWDGSEKFMRRWKKNIDKFCQEY